MLAIYVKSKYALTFIPSLVNYIFLCLSCLFLQLRALVEHWCFMRISIILTYDTVSPAMTYDTVSLPKELWLLFKSLVCFQSILYFCNFCPCFTRHPQSLWLRVWPFFEIDPWWIILVKTLFSFSEKLQIFFFRTFIVVSFSFINSLLLSWFLESWNILTFL